MTAPLRLDVDGASCAFHSRECSGLLIGAGGLDVHHGWPVFMGGPGESADTNACPNHHRRQHALLRYLVEQELAGRPPSWAVLRHFTLVERDVAAYAVARWVDIGRPVIKGWNVPAARDA